MKGDTQIIGILNTLLVGELTAVDQYLIHGEMYADMGFGQLAAKALHEVKPDTRILCLNERYYSDLFGLATEPVSSMETLYV